MTEDEFFAALEKTPRTWYLDEGEIRNSGGWWQKYFGKFIYQCPISSLRNEDSGAFRRAGRELGLDEDFVFDVLAAADNYGNCKLKLRARLLAACGLTEHA